MESETCQVVAVDFAIRDVFEVTLALFTTMSLCLLSVCWTLDRVSALQSDVLCSYQKKQKQWLNISSSLTFCVPLFSSPLRAL